MYTRLTFVPAAVFAICGALICQSNVPAQPIVVRHFAAPSYPPGAWIARVQGTVKAELKIKAEGSVDSVTVTSAHPLLRPGLEETLKRWSFLPTGESAVLPLTIIFELNGDCPEVPGTEKREPNYYTATQVSADLPYTVHISACPPIVTVTTTKTR